MKTSERNRRYRLSVLLLSLFLTVSSLHLLQPICIAAQETDQTVRVGWYETPFNKTDELGRRSGYAYEYQQRISAYTGWNYEYVKGSWPELLKMLEEGRIDLLSDVSYTKERDGKMLFSSLPMGEEEYYIFVSPDNDEITTEDYSTFNGKSAGVNENTVQADLLRRWAKDNGVQIEIVEMKGSEEDHVEELRRGLIDMYVTLDAFSDVKNTVPVCRIGSSEYYFAVSRSCPRIHMELNAAMSRIQEENCYYNQELYSKYISTSGANLYLSAEEKGWLEAHGPVRVGYQDNYLAFCARDPKTGELTGALKEYLNIASNSFENASPEFQAFSYPTAASALEALKSSNRKKRHADFPKLLSDRS